MKITALIGSPRKKGNSDVLADRFLDGAKSSGAEVRKLYLADLDINPCRGCFRNCMIKPGHRCGTFRDDMDMVQDEMLSSDLVLFVSPLYSSSFTSYMATFFERSIPFPTTEIIGKPGTKEGVRFIANPLKGKKAVIAMVQDLIYPQAAAIALQAFEFNVGRTLMMEIVEKIHIVDVRDVGDILKKEDELDKIYAMGRDLALQ